MHPKILVPEGFTEKEDEIIENVFMHELSHYKRKDMITNFILIIITSLHWFNPFVYALFKKIRQEMELATDEIALSKMNQDEKKRYGLTLINLLLVPGICLEIFPFHPGFPVLLSIAFCRRI